MTTDPTLKALLAALDGTDQDPPDLAVAPVAADRLEDLDLLAESHVRRLVLERPAGDGRRLLYAEERERAGDAELAEFVRVQCELARCDIPDADDKPRWDERTRLQDREKKLWGYLPARAGVMCRFEDAPPGSAALLPRDNGTGLSDSYPWAWVCRGFVHTVHCPLAAWEAHGPALVSRHPVERVGVTDDVIEQELRGLYYIATSGLPEAIAIWMIDRGELRRFYSGGANARDALSRELIAWAAERAKEGGLWP